MRTSTPDWPALQGVTDGVVVTPGSRRYEQARKPAWAASGDARPQAVVFASSPADVSEAVRFARCHGLRVTPRSGGHCFAGRSSAGDIIIDVTPMHSVSVKDEIAVVGAGTRLGELPDALALAGRALPVGCVPSVGIAGLTLGGGLGVLGRKHGLTCDRLLGAQVVLADGRIVDCDAEHESELFWALRGAGGGHFGVLTSLIFATVPVPAAVTCFDLRWAPRHATTAIGAWQAWGPAAPDEVHAELRVAVGPGSDAAPVVSVFGTVLGTTSEAQPLLDDLVARIRVDPMIGWTSQVPYLDLKPVLASRRAENPVAGTEEGWLEYSRSEFFRRPLPRGAITALEHHLPSDPPSSLETREVTFTPLGGAYNRVAPDATAFVHREESFLVEHVVRVPPAATGLEITEAREWLACSWRAVHPWGSGRVYPNFPAPDLPDWPDAYYGANYARLLLVKRRYDPDHWFRFPQSIGSYQAGARKHPTMNGKD